MFFTKGGTMGSKLASIVGVALMGTVGALVSVEGCGSGGNDAGSATTSSSASNSGATASSTSSSGTSASSSGSGGAGGGFGSGGAGGSDCSGGAGPGADVTVVVVDLAGAPAPGQLVVVNCASGAIVSQTQTGIDGKANVHVPSGGLVTYTDSGFPFSEAEGAVDPPDGSTITFHTQTGLSPNLPTTFHLTLTGYPASTANLGLNDCMYGMTVPANFAITIADITNDGCFKAQKTNQVLVVAYDASKNPLAWGSAENIAEVAGQSVPVAIAVNQATFQTFTETITPTPAGAQWASAYAQNNVVGNLSSDIQGFTMFPGAAASWSFDFPASDLMSMSLQEGVQVKSGSFLRVFSRITAYKNLPPMLTFDPTTLATVDLNPLDVSDPGHPKLSWAVGPGSQGAGIVISLHWYYVDTGGSLKLVLAPGSTTFRFPDGLQPGDHLGGYVALVHVKGDDNWLHYLTVGDPPAANGGSPSPGQGLAMSADATLSAGLIHSP